MTIPGLDELDALAAGATPGPWKVFRGHYNDGVETLDGHMVIPFEDEELDAAGTDTRETAAYIAALPPERVRAMIACIRAAVAMREQYGPCAYCDGVGWYVVLRPNRNTGYAEEGQEQCANCAAQTSFDSALAAIGGKP